jgi:tetratricopeptide (TPR) repeat protein
VTRQDDDPIAIAQRALAALDDGHEAEMLPAVEAAAVRIGDNPLLWQCTGLLHRALGDLGPAIAAFTRAARLAPADAKIAQGHAQVELEAGQDAVAAFERARTVLGDSPFLAANAASMLSETGDMEGADALFARVADGDDETLAVRRVRHLLRNGRLDAALPLIDRWTARPAATMIWPYASIAWRLAGDARWDWLEGDDRLVSVIDLADRLPDLDRLAATLRALHLARAQPFDQSVRGGTQTDGHLLLRTEPDIHALRAAVVSAVEQHIAALPSIDPTHPTLRHRRDGQVRFAGAWSVRLSGAGHHVAHIHPAGWLSSALYVAVPGEVERGAENAGWLALGEPPVELGLDLPATRLVEPRPGRLVLFPSTLWHGTRPFAAGERLTVAFDVAPAV